MKLVLNGWLYDHPHTGSGQYLHNLLAHLPAVAPDIETTVVVPGQLSAPLTNDQLQTDGYLLHALNLPSPLSNLSKVKFEQLDFPSACKSLGADLAHVPY